MFYFGEDLQRRSWSCSANILQLVFCLELTAARCGGSALRCFDPIISPVTDDGRGPGKYALSLAKTYILRGTQ